MTKKNLIVFACDQNFLFTLSVALLSLNDKSPIAVKNSEVLIFYQGFTDEDKSLIQKIHPCTLIEYKFPIDINLEHENFKKFTQLAFARYELFPMLNDYKKILYIDVDVMITGELQWIFDNYGDISGIAMSEDTQKGLTRITKNFIEPMDEYDMSVPCYNSGVSLYCDNIPNRDKLRMWCYEKTAYWLENLVCPDQGVLNVMLQEFNIKLEVLPDSCNCTPSNYKYYDKSRDDILIYHCAGGGVRFWRYSYNAQWEKYYKEYLNLGGKEYPNNDKQWRKFIKKYKLYRYDFFERSPNPSIHLQRFIKYLLTYPYYYFFQRNK